MQREVYQVSKHKQLPCTLRLTISPEDTRFLEALQGSRSIKCTDELPDVLELTLIPPTGSKIHLSDSKTDQLLLEGECSTLTWRLPTRFTLTDKGISFSIGDKRFGFRPTETVEEWQSWWTPDKTLEDLQALGDDATTTNRRLRPPDAIKLQPLLDNLSLTTQSHLINTVKDTLTAGPSAWERKKTGRFDGYTLRTKNGTALLEGITDFPSLKKFVELLGVECLQTTLATAEILKTHIRRTYPTLPQTVTDIKPILVTVSDLLRAMGKRPRGNSYSTDQQLRARRHLKAQSWIDYADVKPTKAGKAKLGYGPFVNVVKTEIEPQLPYDDLPDPREVVSIIVLPGDAILQSLKINTPWLHPKLLQYDPKKRTPEILIGLYVCTLQLNRRNKQGQEYVAIGSIEREIGLPDKNPRRLMTRIHNALDRLAADGLIPGETDTSTGNVTAIYEAPKAQARKLDSLEAARAKRVKILHNAELPNGYKPLPTSTQPPP